ncbi:MAG: carboxymuconolactone decarboxylase family protein [Candidatus Binataceae bacterium]
MRAAAIVLMARINRIGSGLGGRLTPPGSATMADFYSKETSKNLRKLRQLTPDSFKGFLDFDQAVFKDGAIPSKTKELMAITAAHVTQCPWCIEAHVSRAKEKGCTDEEIAEAVWVAAAMRAGAAFSHGAIAMAVTEEHKH